MGVRIEGEQLRSRISAAEVLTYDPRSRARSMSYKYC